MFLGNLCEIYFSLTLIVDIRPFSGAWIASAPTCPRPSKDEVNYTLYGHLKG